MVDGYVRDEASLGTLLRRRLLTAGVVAAHLAAASCAAPDANTLRVLDGEAEVRLPAPAAREASRAQGRGLVRVASVAWPSAAWAALGQVARAPHHPLAIGVATAAAGGSPRDAALVALYLTGTATATAAARLLGLDPVTVAAVLASLGPLQDALATDASEAVARGDEVPAESDPLTDLLVTRHAPRQDKLFAS
ncbi:urease accessory protein [Quadrisphaera granulorum]|uniref:Urease accessory protein n=1 Tax=Quadrisphaera granulorum TaxID=317664 RepID=A0A316AS32_9ACTN|nr:urease accessory protein [Quadrisphaera granulorum]SZE97299.1 urease accessory protein [Quadrisphaera granulorum]